MSLFRKQVAHGKRPEYLGKILLAHPLSFTFLTAFFTSISVLFVAFFALAKYTSKEEVHGVLLPPNGLIGLYSPQNGIVIERWVQEGQEVREGEDLFVLSSERVSSTRGDTQVAIGSSLSLRNERLKEELEEQRKQARQQHAALEHKRDALQFEIDQIKTEISLQRSRAALAEEAVHRYTELQSSHFVSAAQVQDKASDNLDQQSRLHALERTRSNLLQDLATVEADIEDQPLRARREASTIERSIAELDQSVAENEALRRIIVRAPKSGLITAIACEQGQSVTANAPMATIVPTGGRLEAQLYADSRAIGFVHPGTRVTMRYQAFPFQKFGQHWGTVRNISGTAIPPQQIAKIFALPESSTEPMYRIDVRLDDDFVSASDTRQPLKAGMQLDASIMLEQRRMYEWIFDPLKSVVGKI
jgi:membrane fusion protein